MKVLIAAFALAGVLTAPAAGAAWGYQGAELVAQAQKGRHDRGGQGRDYRPERRDRFGDERRERLSDDERRALHRDLDKANRELYHPRHK